MTDHVLPREFLLAAACCRWPLSEPAIVAIRLACKDKIDWAHFLRVVRCQRVVGLAHHALGLAGIELPPSVEQQLATQTQRLGRQNVMLAAESVRLQRAFDAAQIPLLILKGATLAQLAYGSLAFKHSRDIDLLIPPDCIDDALLLLKQDGYVLLQPAENLSPAQQRAVVQYGSEVALIDRRRGYLVELRWRLLDNPFRIVGTDVFAQPQRVVLTNSGSVYTLADEILYAFLCAHGATHGWSRLKWLADLSAWLAQKSEADIDRLYRHAQAAGGGLCAGQAMLLCHRLLGSSLPASLKDELQRNRRLEILVAMAIDVMTGPDGATELQARPFGSTRVSLMQFLLGRGWTHFFAQCRVIGVNLADVIDYPLPSSLYFLYPILRLPLWLRRRVIGLGKKGATAKGV